MMTTAAFDYQRLERETADNRSELILLSLIWMVIVATGVLGQVALAGLLTASVLLVGSTLLRLSGSTLGLRKASILGALHLAAVVFFILAPGA